MYYMNVEKFKKIFFFFTFRSPSSARDAHDFQTPCYLELVLKKK